jgi:L-amino acid N-acyltransferase YncA
VSLALAPAARGQRLGSALLEAGCCRAAETGFAHAFDAYIRPKNSASIRCFERAGFMRVGDALVKGQRAVKFSRNEAILRLHPGNE